MTEVSDHDVAKALDRIARTEDGWLLYLFLQKTLCGLALGGSDSTLREREGRRKFAAELMYLMSEGIRGGRDQHERPIVFARGQPAAVRGRVSARDFFAANPDAWPERSGRDSESPAND